MKIQSIILIAAALLMIACKGGKNDEGAVWSEPVVEEDSVVQPAEEPAAVADDYFDKMVAQPTVKPAPKPAARPAVKKVEKPTAETIYVETDGAQGRVWGHVTMRGDRGSGTIHDWDENTLTVTVTRHGDELFAVDQNSRQYVFKLKK